MPRRSFVSASNAFFVSAFTSLALLAACSSEEPADDTPASGGSSGSTAGTTTTGGGAGTGGSSGTGTGGGGAAGSGTGGSAGSKAGGAGTGTSGAGAGGSAGAGMSGNAGSTAGGGSGGGSGGALGGAGSGGAAAGGTAGSAGSAGTAGASGSGGSGSGAFELRSPAFEYSAECSDEARETCEVFPDENIQYMGGGNTSPELSWTGVPAGTMSFALVLQDLSNGFAHWVLWNIPGSATGLPAGIDKTSDMPSNVEGAQQAGLGSGAEDHGYFGPGSSCNVYQFALYALSMATFSPTQATNQTQVRMQLEALGDAILGTTELTGRSNYMMMCSD